MAESSLELVPTSPPANERPSMDERISRAVEAMRARPRERWTVASLARVACLSRAAFARRFAREVGTGPLHFLTACRMRLAERLLVESDEPLVVIADQVGYDSEFSFSRAFKRHVSVPPGIFRRSGGGTRPLSITSLRAA